MTGKNFLTAVSGVPIPQILYGTAWKKEATATLVQQAIEQGFRGIDTAGQPRHYDEAGVGAGVVAALHGSLTRQDLYLQTKFSPLPGQDPQRVPFDPAAPPSMQVAQSFESSLRNLRTGYVDCLVLHSPLPDAAQMIEVWQAMESIAAGGGARQLGISNCYSLRELEELYAAARIKPAAVQNRFYADTAYDRGIRAFCRQHGIMYQSFWTLTANPDVLVHRIVKVLAAKYACTAAQIMFRYLTQEGVVPLTGTCSPLHMREDLDIFAFELADSERAAMSALL